MFGYKSVLQLVGGGQPTSSLASGGSAEFELSDFSYEITQATDGVGKPQSEVQVGRMNLTFPNLPTNEMLEWMLLSRKYKNGVVVLYDIQEEPVQKITFLRAACVAMSVRYSESDENYCSTDLTIVAKGLQVGEVEMENTWKNC